MLRGLLFFISIFVSHCCLAQDTTCHYLNYGGLIISQKDSAYAVRYVISYEKGSSNKLYKVQDFYLNGKLRLLGQSTDSLGSKIEGPCIEYFTTGQKKRFYTLKNGNYTGDMIYYYPNGNVYLIKRMKSKISALVVDECRDQEGHVLCKDGTGEIISYNPYNETFAHWTSKDRYKDYIQEGESEMYTILENDTLHVVMNYEKGLLKFGKTYTNSGKQYEFNTEFKKMLCKKGNYWVMRQIRNNLENVPYTSDMWVIVEMFVRSDGELKDIKIVKSQPGVVLNRKTLDVLQQPGIWVAGSKYGKPVNTKLIVAIDMRNYNYYYSTEISERSLY